MDSATVIQDWDSDGFHNKVLEMEMKGYVTRQETYNIRAEMDPETGRIVHQYTIEVYKPSSQS